MQTFFDRWVDRLPWPLTSVDRAAGYRHRLSLWQVEVRLTQIPREPVSGRRWFEAILRENLDLGRPDRVSLLFPTRMTRATPPPTRGYRTRVFTAGVTPTLHVSFKFFKIDILRSMKSQSICDSCRELLLSDASSVSRHQVEAIDALLERCSALLTDEQPKTRKAVVFVGSSSEGLDIANRVQLLLSRDLEVIVWNQTVFGLGSATLEVLEAAAARFDYAVFVLTPDDELQSRGTSLRVPRDNVVFELGLFIGTLSRKRAFVIQPATHSLKLPSDLAGITTARFDPEFAGRNLSGALGPACEELRVAIQTGWDHVRGAHL